MIDPNDPKFQQIAGTIISGLANLFQQCVSIYQAGQTQQSPQQVASPSPPPPPPPPPKPIAPQSAAIRPQNVPSSIAAEVAEDEMPPSAPSQDSVIRKSELRIPTWAQLINLYSECAAANYKRNFKPEPRTSAQVISGIQLVLKKLKIRLDEPYTSLTRAKISRLEDIGLKLGKSRATIQAWRGFVKSITAKWAIVMYEDRGWNVESIVTQPFNIAQRAYEELPAETILKIDEWIAKKREGAKDDRLTKEQYKFLWILRNTAARNGDVFRFTWNNFTPDGEDKVRSAYVPNKTSKTSLRKATWTFSKPKWMELGEFKGDAADESKIVRIPENRQDEFQRELNREIRAILPEGRNKGLYELRKLRITEVYKKFGREAAVRISGDSFNTLEMSYADRSAGGEDQLD